MYYNTKAFYRDYPLWKKEYWKSFFIKNKDVESKEINFFNAYDTIPHTKNIDMKNIKKI